MSDDIEVTITIGLGLVGCQRKRTVLLPREEWEEMTPRERDEYLLEEVQQVVEWDYEAINE